MCTDKFALGVTDTKRATQILSGGLCTVTMHYGGYSGLSDAYGALMKWIQSNEYKIGDSPYEIYLKTQFDKLHSEQWEMKIFFPVKKE